MNFFSLALKTMKPITNVTAAMPRQIRFSPTSGMVPLMAIDLK